MHSARANRNYPLFIFQNCILVIFFSLIIALLPITAVATNLSGVHGPNVKANEKSAQVRVGYSPSDIQGQVDFWGYRAHYQQALNEKLRARIVLQARDRGNFEYDYLKAEFLYNFKKRSNDSWSSGVRFDLRTRKGNRPEDYAISWTNEWSLENGMRVRGILAASRQFGSDNASTGTSVQTRASVSNRLENGLRLGVELYNSYGELGDFGSFDEQRHQIGPMLGGRLGEFTFEVRYLMGLTNNSRDHDFGLRFNRSF